MNEDTLKSLRDMTLDLIKTPIENESDNDYLKDILNSETFTQTEIEDLNSAIRLIFSQSKESDLGSITDNLWKVNFVRKPPTPEEFLSYEYLGDTSENIFPHIRKYFIEFFDPTKPYRNLVLYDCIGSGKSFLVSLILTYIATHISLMRNHKKFFHLNAMSHIVMTIIAMTLDQAYDLVIRGILNLMASSPQYERCKTEEMMIRKMKEYPEKLFYTTAAKGNAVFRLNDVYFYMISDASQLLGLSIITGSLTELAFFKSRGMSDDNIWKLLTDTRLRVFSRFPSSIYYARTIIDSSPNSMENKIDRYCYEECLTNGDPTIYRVNEKKWILQPDKFPIWEKNKKVFYLYKGSATREVKVMTDVDYKLQQMLGSYDPVDIIECPIDAYSIAYDAPTKFLMDYCAIPANSSEDKCIHNTETIEGIFTPYLKNISFYERASATQAPEGLLWNIIKKELFVYNGQGKQYSFYRNPYVERFVSIDLAVKKDMASVSMVHQERDKEGRKIFVVDFTLPILSVVKDEINLEAFQYLIYDMVKYGNIQIKKVSFDGFQSDEARQWLIRHDLDAVRFSVDISNEPYMNLFSLMSQGRVKLGRNLVIKNNLKSLIYKRMEKKIKIDHVIIGNWTDLDNKDWEISKQGYGGKDGSDSMCAAISLCNTFGTDMSDLVYEEEEVKNSTNTKIILEDAFIKMNKEFGYLLPK